MSDAKVSIDVTPEMIASYDHERQEQLERRERLLKPWPSASAGIKLPKLNPDGSMADEEAGEADDPKADGAAKGWVNGSEAHRMFGKPGYLLLRKGDLDGHEFRGNQYTKFGERSGPRSEGESLEGLHARLSTPDGGFSYHPVTAFEPKQGFMLSRYPGRSQVFAPGKITPHDIAAYIRKNRDLLKTPDHFFGGWNDPDTGEVFLDVSERFTDRDEAKAASYKYDQLRYFDLEKGQSVLVEGTSGGRKAKAAPNVDGRYGRGGDGRAYDRSGSRPRDDAGRVGESERGVSQGVAKGDFDGHPFRGNQHSGGIGGANENPHADGGPWAGQNPRRTRYGVVVMDGDKVLLREPANHYEGFHWTFARGGADKGETPAQTAIREGREELGHDIELGEPLPQLFRGGNPEWASGYYVAQSRGESGKPDWETASTQWATYDEARALIMQSTNLPGQKRDLEVLDAAFGKKSKGLVRKGDSDGHPFRGNQHTGGAGDASERDDSDDPLPVKYTSGSVESPENFTDVWTGAPRSVTALVAQHAAEEMGWGRAFDSNREAGGKPIAGSPEQREQAKRVLLELYRDTQADLAIHPPPKTDGNKIVYLYRGTGSRNARRGNIESWTSDSRIADEMADGGHVQRVRIHLSEILAWHGGPHWGRDMGESEYIIAHGAPSATSKAPIEIVIKGFEGL